MNINFIFDESDAFSPKEAATIFNYSSSKSLHYTFWQNRFVPQNWYSNEAIDLLYISFAVFAADRLSRRGDAADGWSRDIKLYIPVLSFNVWISNRELLEEMLDFLSGDMWSIEFRQRSATAKEVLYKNKWEKKKVTVSAYDKVCMFSGGLDSFIGAIDLLEEKNDDEKVLFVSHYGGGKGTKEYQDLLMDKLCRDYGIEKTDFQQFHAAIVNGVEDTTRTRSFMFFAHAIVLASTFGRPVGLTIPENGLISLNIPSTFSRIGTSSTRTTHPFYMKKLQELLTSANMSVTLNNPYQFKTKGEMLVYCKGQEFLKENVSHTMSCSHPDVGRHRGETHTMHCGYCLPCVIRRAAIKKADIADRSRYYDPECRLGDEAKINLNSYRQGLRKFDPEHAFMTIQQNGPVTDEIESFADLYKRGIAELQECIEDIE